MELAAGYDSLPYPSKFFLQTHPDRLATLGKLFGMNPQTPEKCRILELGCGNGSNLISHAFNLPESEFVGVDISGEHIKAAKDWANELNLQNIHFHEIDLLEMNVADFGKFDFITAHGLISWIPEFVRKKVFELFAEMLAENGIGYISYNAYPGAHYRKIARDVMRFHTKNIENPVEKVQNAISFLSFVAENSNETKTYKPLLEKELHRHFEHSASDIYHDDLSEVYEPYYFHEFADLLDQHELQYLSEAEMHAMSIQKFPAKVQEHINQFDDVIEREQLIDFFLGRVFRQTLFCRKNVKLERNLTPNQLDDFLIASAIHPQNDDPDLFTAKTERFVDNKNFGIEIDHPPTKFALKLLGENWGKAVPTAEMMETIQKTFTENDVIPEDWEKELEITRAILFQIYRGTDLIELHTHQPKADQTVAEKPKINGLARWQIKETDHVTTLYGLNIKVEDEVSRHLLELLDGTNDRSELLVQIRNFIENNDEIEGKNDLLENIDNWLDSSLQQLAKLGMFA